MKVSKEKAAAHRAAILAAAGKLFREKGFDGVGVAEITKAAGLTHGGFYGHFASKGALAAEACDAAFEETIAYLIDGSVPAEDALDKFLSRYLSSLHRDRPDLGCPMGALTSEIPRQDPAVQERFAANVQRFVTVVQSLLPASGDAVADRRRAIAAVSALIGGIGLARATVLAAPELSDEILASLKREFRSRFTD